MSNTKYECKNPIFSSFNNSTINLDYKHPDYGWIPFTASSDDVEVLGRELYTLASSGAFGEVTPYDGPTESELLEVEARGERDRLLRKLDALVSNPLRYSALSEEVKLELVTYRQALLDYPQQDGFPNEADLPTCQLLSK